MTRYTNRHNSAINKPFGLPAQLTVQLLLLRAIALTDSTLTFPDNALRQLAESCPMLDRRSFFRRLAFAGPVLATLGLGVTALAGSPGSALADARDVAVEVRNLSEPVRCAEKDNVYIPIKAAANGPMPRSFRIEVLHPAYIGTLAADRQAPDWAQCDMTADPVFLGKPRETTLVDNGKFKLIAYSYPSLWRPSTVPVMVGDRREEGVHMLQLWVTENGRSEEVVVVYPQDGYWRGRPMSPQHLGNSAYGTSFLVGPVETEGRPIVVLKNLVFDPATGGFSMGFVRGGTGTVGISTLDQDRLALAVDFDAAVPDDHPFAALRSMYVTETNADAARVAWVNPDGKGWGEAPVMGFTNAATQEFWLGRTLPSRHNTSAPDISLSRFRAAPSVVPAATLTSGQIQPAATQDAAKALAPLSR